MNSTIKEAAKVVQELNQSNENSDTKSILHIKAKLREFLKKNWESKVMHGHYMRSRDRQFISEEDTFLWLSRGAESEIIAAQDQALKTIYHMTKILRTETDSKCRL
jgi:predicted ATPase